MERSDLTRMSKGKETRWKGKTTNKGKEKRKKEKKEEKAEKNPTEDEDN